MASNVKAKKWGWLVLFTCCSTHLCCTIPIVLVGLGMGSAVATIYGEYFPFLQWFGLNSNITFGATALILAAAGWALYRPGQTCPSDPELASACNSAHKWNIRLFWVACVIWGIGFFTAFILPAIES